MTRVPGIVLALARAAAVPTLAWAGVDISKIKVGDEVRAVMIEALVLNVERVAPGK